MALEVGNKIDAWCGRCKSVLRHTIEIMTGEKVRSTDLRGEPLPPHAVAIGENAQAEVGDA